ncbi:MAG: hypothetical protein U5L74_10560 [Ideonella sp.]|nr:hypothetical protein [Ideonella sp.]
MSEHTLLLRFVELALLISSLEVLWLVWRAPAGRPRLAVLANLAAGLSLMLALRLALGGAGLWPLLACLSGAGLAHVADLRLRNVLASVSPTSRK